MNPNPIYARHHTVISGCSGGGKSTLIAALADRGFATAPEPGRAIVREQLAIGGEALPWRNLPLFLDLVRTRYIQDFEAHLGSKDRVFFDRSLIDCIAPHLAQPPHFALAAQKFRYASPVFLVPPWPAIYQQDAERRHTFDDAVAEYTSLLATYPRFGYTTVIIPKCSVEERIDFILGRLAEQNTPSK